MAISYLKTKEGSLIEEIPLWTDVETVESQALDQLRNVASLPWLAHLSVMPDVHYGNGATVGSVIAMHGAGRKMSRGKAKKKFTVQDLIKQTNGVECRKDSGVIDEIPGAYKKIESVIAYSDELVEIVTELKPAIICVKG